MNNLFQIVEREMAIMARRLEAIRITYLSHSEIDRSTYLLLRQLHDQGPQSIKELAEAMLVDISTASRQALALENKQFVEKLADPNDARIKLLRITERGYSEYMAYSKLRENFYIHLLQDWDDEACRQLGNSIAHLNRTVEEYHRESKLDGPVDPR